MGQTLRRPRHTRRSVKPLVLGSFVALLGIMNGPLVSAPVADGAIHGCQSIGLARCEGDASARLFGEAIDRSILTLGYHESSTGAGWVDNGQCLHGRSPRPHRHPRPASGSGIGSLVSAVQAVR